MHRQSGRGGFSVGKARGLGPLEYCAELAGDIGGCRNTAIGGNYGACSWHRVGNYDAER